MPDFFKEWLTNLTPEQKREMWQYVDSYEDLYDQIVVIVGHKVDMGDEKL